MIVIDEKKIFQVISERKPVSIALNGPDGILPKVQKTATNITEKFDTLTNLKHLKIML